MPNSTTVVRGRAGEPVEIDGRSYEELLVLIRDMQIEYDPSSARYVWRGDGTTNTSTVAADSRVVHDCSNCGRGRYSNNWCANCERGASCCGCLCKACESCKKAKVKPSHFCEYCGVCRSVCECRSRKGHFKDLSKIKSTTHINTLNRHLGVELEIGEWNNLSPTHKPKSFGFRVVGDSSVTPSGKEMVVNPLIGDNFLTAATELAKILHDNDCVVNESCGLHVHVNAIDLNWWSLRRMLQLWLKVEYDIYNHIIDENRSTNTYCRRKKVKLTGLYNQLRTAKSASEIKHALLKEVYSLPSSKGDGRTLKVEAGIYRESWKKNKANKYGADNRYWGLNFHTYFYRGTVEFRMFEGTTDLADLVHWPLVCGWLVEKASTLTDKQVDGVEGLLDFTQKYCPAPVVAWVEAKIAANDNDVDRNPARDEN